MTTLTQHTRTTRRAGTRTKRVPRPMPAPTSHTPVPMLRAWRLSKLWTQVQLAQASGVSVPTVIRAESGTPVHALTATRLARALGITVRQLRDEEPAQ